MALSFKISFVKKSDPRKNVGKQKAHGEGKVITTGVSTTYIQTWGDEFSSNILPWQSSYLYLSLYEVVIIFGQSSQWFYFLKTKLWGRRITIK